MQLEPILRLHTAVDTILTHLTPAERNRVHAVVDDIEAEVLNSREAERQAVLSESDHEAIDEIMRLPVRLRESAKPMRQVRQVMPSPQTLSYLRAEADWLRREPHEHVVVFSLDDAGEVCGCTRMSDANPRACALDVGRTVREALGHGAVSAIVMHQHPSRTVAEPSADDDTATDALREALAHHGIGLIDHIILAAGSGHVHSYRESAAAPISTWDLRCEAHDRLWAPYRGTPAPRMREAGAFPRDGVDEQVLISNIVQEVGNIVHDLPATLVRRVMAAATQRLIQES